MSDTTDIAVIGAGPYGLSVAAHLNAAGADFRIFGKPMGFWRDNMPEGMLLKSAGFASNLYEPGKTFTLKAYCAQRDIPYLDDGLPVSLNSFYEYGMDFQRCFVPQLENEEVVDVVLENGRYLLRLKNGAIFAARKLVIATGIKQFRHMPDALSEAPPHLVSHSGDHRNLAKFHGQRVIVVGAGASAIDTAVLLHEAGAQVQQVIRRNNLNFGDQRERADRSILRKIRVPVTGIGPGWRNQMFSTFPFLFRYLPDSTRIRIVGNHLGPSGGWFMKDRAASIPMLFSHKVTQVQAAGSHMRLHLQDAHGNVAHVEADHLIAGTGYRVDIRRLCFLSPEILQRIELIRGSPILSSHFESSIPGLYFVGAMAAMTFGPMMRFAVGADFTSRRISRHLLHGR